MTWVPPWRPGLPIAACAMGRECRGRHRDEPATRVVAVTLDENGLCVLCAARPPAPEPEPAPVPEAAPALFEFNDDGRLLPAGV